MKKIIIVLVILVLIFIAVIAFVDYRKKQSYRSFDAICKQEAGIKSDIMNDGTTTKKWFDCMQQKGVKFYR